MPAIDIGMPNNALIALKSDEVYVDFWLYIAPSTILTYASMLRNFLQMAEIIVGDISFDEQKCIFFIN